MSKTEKGTCWVTKAENVPVEEVRTIFGTKVKISTSIIVNNKKS